MSNINIIELLLTILSWGIIGFFIIRIYQKQEENPRIWRIFLVTYVGMFSFSFKFPFFIKEMEIALLPLGLWIVYAILKNKNWKQYRQYAWLGFIGNYIFLSFALLSILIYHLVYDEDSITHYISDMTEADVISIYPTGNNHQTLREDSMEFISAMKKEEVFYDEMFWGGNFQKKDERFPYLLVGSKPKWGSGANAEIYIERDGKGIIINTIQESLYFRSNESLLKEGAGDE